MSLDTAAYKKSSFGPAFLFLNKQRREALAAYYVFCRKMDDIADEPNIADRCKELDTWRQEIERVFQNQAQTELGKELQNKVLPLGLPPDRFLLLIEGMQADVDGKSYATFEALEWYLWRVAGIVGLATLDILGVKGNKAQALARALGFAVQTTNIVRDVYEDVQLGRVYLPDDFLAAEHLSRGQLLNGEKPAALPKVLARVAQKSHQLYGQAEEIMLGFPRRKMLVCRIMSFVYQANLAKIEKTGFVFDKPVKLSKFQKLKACMYALCKTVFYH